MGLSKRQGVAVVDGDGNVRGYDSWWSDTTEGNIVKWSIFFGFIFLCFAFVIGGRWHAMRRIKKGLTPLAYHRWLLSRRQRALYDPSYREPQVYYTVYPPNGQPGGAYNMYPMPPPTYDPHSAPPPTYQPPAGGSKVDPAQAGQSYGVVSSQQPFLAQGTGSSNNPYRQ